MLLSVIVNSFSLEEKEEKKDLNNFVSSVIELIIV